MTDHRLQKVKVLVVDDSRVVRVAASKMFGEEFDVLLSVDGKDGLSIIERNPDIDVVFTDLAMPEMDGFELLSAIRKNINSSIRNLPVIVATGAGNSSAAKQKAFALGATDFITKPFNMFDIKARAQSYASFRKENKELTEQTTIDAMTGMLNDRGLRMQLDKELSFVERHKSHLTVMSVEVDEYKDLFVRIGREGTEKLITRVSEVFKTTFRKEDSIARTRLARFTVSMPMADPRNILETANRISETVENFKARLDGKKMKISVSIGLATVGHDKEVDVSELLSLADESLDRALKKGKSQIHRLELDEYRSYLQEEATKSISIDEILDEIDNGNQLKIANKLDMALERLAPMFDLLSNETFQKLFTMRQFHPKNNVVTFGGGQHKGATNKG